MFFRNITYQGLHAFTSLRYRILIAFVKLIIILSAVI